VRWDDDDPGLPIKFGPCANDEYEPPPLSLDERMKGFIESDEVHEERPDPLARGASKAKSDKDKAATT